MTALANNCDVLCNHLRVVYKNLHGPIKNKLDLFLATIRDDLQNASEPLNIIIQKRWSTVFQLRIAALKWIVSENENVTELLDGEVYPYFQQMRSNDRLSRLADNILFALRSNKKVVDFVLATLDNSKFSSDSISNFPEISFDQFIATIPVSNPTATKSIIEWFTTSFEIEYVICATAMLYDEKLIVPDKKIDELSELIINAAQNYSAIAVELGLIPTKKNYRRNDDFIESPGFLKEQQSLAEAGISSFGQNWKS